MAYKIMHGNHGDVARSSHVKNFNLGNNYSILYSHFLAQGSLKAFVIAQHWAFCGKPLADYSAQDPANLLGLCLNLLIYIHPVGLYRHYI